MHCSWANSVLERSQHPAVPLFSVSAWTFWHALHLPSMPRTFPACLAPSQLAPALSQHAAHLPSIPLHFLSMPRIFPVFPCTFPACPRTFPACSVPSQDSLALSQHAAHLPCPGAAPTGGSPRDLTGYPTAVYSPRAAHAPPGGVLLLVQEKGLVCGNKTFSR